MQAVIKPTTQCNLSCLYCNVEAKSDERLSLLTVQRFFDYLADRYPDEKIVIRWHGGEPLLMGLDFFVESFRYQETLNHNFENEISTNLTLIDDRFIDLIKRHNVAIYTSLDTIGPSHDQQRSNSLDLVRKNLLKLSEANISDICVRSTIGKYNVDTVESVYDFCAEYNYKWDFSAVVPAGLKREKTLSLIVDPQEFSRVAIKTFDRWFKSETMPTIVILQYILEYILHKDEVIPASKPRLSLGPNGYIYSCPLLIGNDKYAVGEFDDLDTTQRFHCITCTDPRSEKSQCLGCELKFLCKLTHCAYFFEVQNSFPELCDYMCGCWQPVYTHIMESIESEIQTCKTLM